MEINPTLILQKVEQLGSKGAAITYSEPTGTTEAGHSIFISIDQIPGVISFLQNVLDQKNPNTTPKG